MEPVFQMVYLLAAGALLLIVDQTSKQLAERAAARAAPEPGRILAIRPVASAKRVYSRRPVRIALTALWVAILASALILDRAGRFADVAGVIGIGAAIGGAAGNLLDIHRSHAVRDFIDLKWWPAFNVADVAIIGGLAIAFFPR